MDDTERRPPPGRKFLCVVDETPECKLALRFAARRAEHTGGRVTLLYVIEPAEFQHWQSVGELMREEARDAAENRLSDLAADMARYSGVTPEFVIREGQRRDELLKLIAEDDSIRILVLAAGTGRDGPGPLVSALAGDAAGALRTPITIVPGGLTPEQVDDLS